MGGIDGDHLTDDEPVEQHADGGEELFDGRLFEILTHGLDVGRDWIGSIATSSPRPRASHQAKKRQLAR